MSFLEVFQSIFWTEDMLKTTHFCGSSLVIGSVSQSLSTLNSIS